MNRKEIEAAVERLADYFVNYLFDEFQGTRHVRRVATWIGFLRKERNIVWALLRRKIRLQGPLKLLVAFGKCFPQ